MITEEHGLRIGEKRGIDIERQAIIARWIERKLGPLQMTDREHIAQLSAAKQMSLMDDLIDDRFLHYSDLLVWLAKV